MPFTCPFFISKKRDRKEKKGEAKKKKGKRKERTRTVVNKVIGMRVRQ